jgi:hypothetical protein
MTRMTNILIRCSIAAVVAFVGVSWNGHISQSTQSSFVSSAEARIGRPMTPMSYAGVARRTTRRAVGVGVVRRPVVVVPGGAACAQVVDAYGRIVRVCR